MAYSASLAAPEGPASALARRASGAATTGRTELGPYTHELHGQRCVAAAAQRIVLAGVHVQVKKRGVIFCAQLVEPWTTPTGIDCWTVESHSPEHARFTVPCRQVRLCGGLDGRCACDAEARTAVEVAFSRSQPRGAFSQAGVVAPPESLTHETLPVARG